MLKGSIFLRFLIIFLILAKISLRKISIMESPFKFGSLVDAPYFTDRVKPLVAEVHGNSFFSGHLFLF